MSTVVLIAGGGAGSWCWSEVMPKLESAGYRVITPDLLGLSDGTAASFEDPLAVWADQIADLLRQEAEPVVLVGHSRGGLVISEVAERVPGQVCLLVYVTAFLLRDGETMQDIALKASNAEAFASAMDIHDDGTASVKEEALRSLFYNETRSELIDFACACLVPEPLAVFSTPVRVTGGRFGRVPRAYVECLRDLAIPVETQRLMQAALPGFPTISLDTDHSPFLSAPAELVEALRKLSALQPGCAASSGSSKS